MGKLSISEKGICGVVILIIIFFCLIWPTPYRYDHISRENSKLPVKINRLTGKSWVLDLDGWEELTAPGLNSAQKGLKELPDSEREKFQISIDFIGSDSTTANIDYYNGSNWTIREITLLISKPKYAGRYDKYIPKYDKYIPKAEGPNDDLLGLKERPFDKREYTVYIPYGASRFATGSIQHDFGFYDTTEDLVQWEIISIRGYRP